MPWAYNAATDPAGMVEQYGVPWLSGVLWQYGVPWHCHGMQQR